MARVFDDNTANRLGGARGAITEPFTVCLWFKVPNTNVAKTLIGFSDPGNSGYWRLSCHSDAKVRGQKQNNGGTQNTTVASTTSYGTTAWHHIAVGFTSNTSRAILLDGGGGHSTTTTVTDPTVSAVTVGLLRATTAPGVQPMNGSIAYPRVWEGVTLTSPEIVELASGLHPDLMYPELQVEAWEMNGVGSEQSLVGGTTITEAGTVALGEEIPLAMGWPQNISHVPAAATVIPVLHGYYQAMRAA